jgi:outer membrane immunogenic protein
MKRILSSVAAIALAAGIGTAAHAEPFNGPFVGVQGGWSQSDAGTPSTPLGDVQIDRTRDSAVGGAFAGYDLKLGSRVVVGAEAGIQAGTDDSIVRTSDAGRVLLDPRYSFDLTARAGYLVGDNTLLYARGGYANARVRTSIEDVAGIRTASSHRDGWLVGGGIERSLADNVSARVEYRYADLGEGDGRFDRHQALVGVAFRF